MNNPLGVCTWTFGTRPLSKIAKRVADIGLDGVELLGELKAYTAVQAKQILADHNLTAYSLTPENVDLTHPDSAVRRQAIDYFYRLIDFAAELGNPLVSCHGLVGRVAPLATQAEEDEWLVSGVQQVADRAAQNGLKVVFEVLNRYETHQVRTGREALSLLDTVQRDNVALLMDAYHMNIEEADPAAALRTVGNRLGLYHAADSNREGVGRGHTDFAAQTAVLRLINYDGPIIFECTPPGPNPFTPSKGDEDWEWLELFLRESSNYFKKA